MTKIKEKIKSEFPKILFDEYLSKHCTLQVGGPADFFYQAKTKEKFIDLIKFAQKNNISFFIIGKGSNILFDDKGFRGLIIKNMLEEIVINDEQITADAGISIARFISIALKNNLSGLEKWTGLPGTVGGAVYGNAGCNGLETKDILVKATLINPETGKIKEVEKKYFNYSYRRSKIKNTDEIILDATFQLKKQKIPKEKQRKNIKEISEYRQKYQPFGASAGSFFKNPSKDKSAGMLIEKAGLKGKTIGNAKISERHANFIINLGGASAKEIKELAEIVKQQVKDRFGIDLEPEVQVFSQHGKTKI
ncbi:UDP-N-acetylmuramate dehydrogenase [Candidatus Peregrinibacteria bacterium]|nr:UDP-N-acetylmuramate dehydrogenase [Candidatus Peregrinibacteria bacterium]